MFPATVVCVPSKHAGTGPDPSIEPDRKRLVGTGPKILAHRLAFRNGSVWPQPDMPSRTKQETGRMCKNRSDSDPIMMIRATSSAGKNIRSGGSGKSDPARFRLAATAITGLTRNGSGQDPVCLLGVPVTVPGDRYLCFGDRCLCVCVSCFSWWLLFPRPIPSCSLRFCWIFLALRVALLVALPHVNIL